MELQNYEKTMASKEALQYIKDGMLIGIGSGSTIYYLIQLLGEKIKMEGMKIQAVPTSKKSKDLCKQFGIPLYQGESVPVNIDLTIDGADEFDDELNLMKGGGGDLLWEKIVASASKRVIIITDSTKYVKRLGTFGLPIEVIPYALHIVQKKVKEIGFSTRLRMTQEGSIFLTDENNYIIDCEKKEIQDVEDLAHALQQITGVVEHGLFLHMTDIVLMANHNHVDTFLKDNKLV